MPDKGALTLPDKDSANESLSHQALIAQVTTSCPAPIEAVTDFLNDPKNIPVWEWGMRERTLTGNFALIPEGPSTTVHTTLRFTPRQERPLWRRLLSKFTSRLAARMRAESIAGAVNPNFRD